VHQVNVSIGHTFALLPAPTQGVAASPPTEQSSASDEHFQMWSLLGTMLEVARFC